MLGHRADDVASAQALTWLTTGHKRPFTGEVERGNGFAAHQEEPIALCQGLQRILQAVVDHPQQAWPERGRQHLGREFDAIANAHALGFLEDLQVGAAALHPQHFTLEAGLPRMHEGNRVFHQRRVALDAHNVPGHADHARFRRRYWHTHLEPP